MRPEHVPRAAAIEHQSSGAPWSASGFVSEIERADGRAYVIVDHGDVVGACCGRIVLDELEVRSLAVDPRARRRGFGTALLRRLLISGVGAGCVRAVLEVRVSNVAALALYRAHGFRAVSRRARYYPDNQEDAWLLQATLAGYPLLYS